MKLFYTLLLSFVVLTSLAHNNYTPDEPWPADGYDLSYYSRHLNVSVQRFIDNDTLYYLKMKPAAINKYEGYYFLVINKQEADSILLYMLTKEKFTKLRHKGKWFFHFMEDIGAETVYRSLNSYKGNSFEKKAKETEWVFFDHEKYLDTSAAVQAYENKHNPQKKQPSTEAWAQFLNQVGFVIKIMGSGADTRTLYDKVMQSGGY